ncbi:MAG: FHA domain-containing protein [Gammaproteobacteria bacterium]|jgi:pSer/pThr/pTyr-binding forkhead associated (FHA) protein|nr:FHA domain-containing protein [Gammaproteobacteria bacterium]
MARLILSLDNQVLAEYNMTKERYTIGRLPDNDVRIDNPAVSGHHSLIINILNDSFLEDLNSTNGTYVNGKLIKKHALQHGDVITIGHHQLRFSDQQAPETEQDEFEKTMVIPTGQQNADTLAKAEEAAEKAVASAVSDVDAQPDAREDIADSVKLNPEEAAALEDEAPPPRPEEERVEPRHSSTMTGIDPANAPNALPLAKLQVLSGAFAGRELELTKALTTLGRPGVQVAAITRRAEGYYIVHVESGKEDDFPLVNGQPIGAQARKLSDNDVVQLAGVKMGFFAA